MIASTEKSKLCYVLNRDSDENLTISSPLEAHKSHHATYGLVSLDVGFENPVFAAIERSYDPGSKKMLVYYELDLGLNHVVRKLASPVRETSFIMLSVPGGGEGPGGVLVGSQGYLTYRSLFDEDEQGQLLASDGQTNRVLEARLPYREGTDPETTMIVSAATYRDKKGKFFFLLCTEYGDLIKAELSWEAERGATKLRLVYFDSLPAPVLQMRIFRLGKRGFIAASLEGSDSLLLQFRTVDVPDDHPAGGLFLTSLYDAGENTRGSAPMDVDVPNGASKETGSAGQYAGRRVFRRKEKLSFLYVANVLESFAPLLGVCDASTDDGDRALLCATGKGRGGAVRLLKRGMGIMQMSSPYQLPSRIANVFAFKDRLESLFDRFIVVSFERQTKVLEVGTNKVEETASSGFELGEATLCAGQMGTDSLMQVYKGGIRHIPGGRADDATEWTPPVPSKILAACCNNAQVVVALSSGDLVYFEIDKVNGLLLEIEKISGAVVPKGEEESITDNAGDLSIMPSLAIPDVPRGRTRATIFAVADGAKCRVRLYMVKDDGTQQLGLHLAPAPVEDLALVDFGSVRRDADVANGDGSTPEGDTRLYEPNLTLMIGTTQGALVRIAVDTITGSMSGKRSMFLGPDPVRVASVRVSGVPTCFALGTKPWIMHPQGERIAVSPMCTEMIEHATSFSSEESPDGFVTSTRSVLSLLSIDAIDALLSSAHLSSKMPPPTVPASSILGCSFQMSRTRTSGTPRRIVPVVQESDLNEQRFGQKHTVRKRARSPRLYVTLETDHRAKMLEDPKTNGVLTEGEAGKHEAKNSSKRRESGLAALGSWYSRMQLVHLQGDGGDDENEEEEDEEEDEDLDQTNPFQDGVPEAVSALDAVDIENPNDCIICATSTCTFGPAGADPEAISYVIVSRAINLVVSATSPKASTDRKHMEKRGGAVSGVLSVYKVDGKTKKMVHLHDTAIPEVAYAVCPFRDMIVVGMGQSIRLYDLGQRQLLRKSEYRHAVQTVISCIAVTGGDRLFVGDMQESVTLYKYILPGGTGGNGIERREGGRFIPIASDSLSRWVISLTTVDYSTVCGSDKFGNIFVLRLPPELSSVTEEFVGIATIEKAAGIAGSRSTTHRLSVEACVHVGATVVSLTMGSLNNGYELPDGDDEGVAESRVIVYATIDGGVGILAPFDLRSDADFARLVETDMRKRFKSICGRDHVSFRSSFYPVKNVIDGDLCEMFSGLSHEEQEKCSEAVGRSREDLVRKLDELRNTYL